LTTPEIISNQLKTILAGDQVSMEIFANMVAKCSPKYLVETINVPKNWYELTIKAKNMFKDIFVWLKLNNFTNEIKNFHVNPIQNIKNDQDDHNLPQITTISCTESAQNSNKNDSSKQITDNESLKQQTQRSRTKKRLNKKQYEELVKFYTVVSFYPKSKQLNELGNKLNLSLKFIQNWFANRRRRDNFDRSVSKRKIVNCKLNKTQKDALNALFCKNPHANSSEMRELAELHNLDYGAVSRWLNIKRSTNERLLSTKSILTCSDGCDESTIFEQHNRGNTDNEINSNDDHGDNNHDGDDDNQSSIIDFNDDEVVDINSK
jgi:hypothetical protein